MTIKYCEKCLVTDWQKSGPRREKTRKEEGRRRGHELQFIRAIVGRDYSSLWLFHTSAFYLCSDANHAIADNNFSSYEIDGAWHHCKNCEKCWLFLFIYNIIGKTLKIIFRVVEWSFQIFYFIIIIIFIIDFDIYSNDKNEISLNTTGA